MEQQLTASPNLGVITSVTARYGPDEKTGKLVLTGIVHDPTYNRYYFVPKLVPLFIPVERDDRITVVDPTNWIAARTDPYRLHAKPSMRGSIYGFMVSHLVEHSDAVTFEELRLAWIREHSDQFEGHKPFTHMMVMQREQALCDVWRLIAVMV